jgi:hypothetical protein
MIMSAETLINLVKHAAVDRQTAPHTVAGLTTCKWHRFCSGHSLEGANAATLLATARSFNARVIAVRDKSGKLLPLPENEIESAMTRLSEADEIIWRDSTFSGRCG